MKKKIFIYILLIFALCLTGTIEAKEGNITLNAPVMDDVNHTFKYPNIKLSGDIKPYSITLSIENGYFNTPNETLNNKVLTYFDFRGGSNISNAFISTLNTTEKYQVITFNLKSSVNLSDISTKASVIASIQSFLSDITYYNLENKDAKFTLTFSEVELSLTDVSKGVEGIDIIAFKDPAQKTEHYYARINKTVSWTEAYDAAANLKWNGLQGYLVTITSEAEHNFIYQSLGSIQAWMGAAAILNPTKITYNKPGISWTNATTELGASTRYTQNADNDKKIEANWYWVSGPEAGTKVLGPGKYNGFQKGDSPEPNNAGGKEWCAEYGYGTGGVWNDYPNQSGLTSGYYIEFGGFDNESATSTPVSLVNTFRWRDYDYRNIESKIYNKLESSNLTKDTTKEELDELINEAIEETLIDDVTFEITEVNVTNNVLTFNIKVTLGEGTDKVIYNFHAEKNLETGEVELITVANFNPNTFDKSIQFIGISALCIIGIVALLIIIKKTKK